MTDKRNRLQEKFAVQHRYANFGGLLTKFVVRGFRCHTDTVVEIRSPITAFCGLNGTGKTTLLQLAAAAYANGGHTYRVSDFFARGALDQPFATNASVEFWYWNEDRYTQQLTISRSASGDRWSGYKRRPGRNVMYAGLSLYLPRPERRDFVFRDARRLVVEQSLRVDAAVAEACHWVLGTRYDVVEEKTVTHLQSKATVLSVRRASESADYSDAHMGCGEARLQYLVRRIESMPPKSLVLLEEPENSLHQSAQYRLGGYLMDVALRRGHQVLLTTHSDHLLRALPQASRIYLYRRPTGGVDIIPGLTAAQAVSLMTEGHDRALTVLVEDDAARSVLAEIIASVDSHLLETLRIVTAGMRTESGASIAGGVDAIRAAMRTLSSAGFRLAAVLDGDAPAVPEEFIFKLPGSLPPERELLEASAVRALWQANYGLDVTSFLAGYPGLNHHSLFRLLGSRVGRDRAYLLWEAARAYAQTLRRSDAVALANQLREAANQ